MSYNARMEQAYERSWGDLVPEEDQPVVKKLLTKAERAHRAEFEYILREIWWGAKPGGKAWWHLYAMAADLRERGDNG